MFVRHQVIGRVAVLTIDNPPVNALGAGVWEAVDEAVIGLNADPDVAAIVLTGAGRTFVAGADIKVFDTFQTRDDSMARSARTHAVLRRLEDSAKPIVAAIHGQAFGGGLELAMGCHARIAVRDAGFGQLEVRLGIIPGAGGTQRLPRLCGVPLALEMCTKGHVILAPEARDAGLVDEVVDGSVVERAMAFAMALAASRGVRKTRDIPFAEDQVAAGLEACEAVMAALLSGGVRVRAPYEAVRAIEAGVRLGFDTGSLRERELFADCVMSTESRAMRHLFFAERQAAKLAPAPDGARPSLRRVGVIGEGPERDAIAAACADAGFSVVVNARALADVDIVIDAVVERLDAKALRFAELSRITAPGGLLVSSRHTLFEIVRRPQTSDALVTAAVKLAKRLGKTPVIVGNGGGFVTDRLRACLTGAEQRGGNGGLDDDEAVTRITNALAGEGRRLLSEGLVARAGDIDVIACHGLDFPRFLGGPMFHAGTLARAPV